MTLPMTCATILPAGVAPEAVPEHPLTTITVTTQSTHHDTLYPHPRAHRRAEGSGPRRM